MGCSGTVHHASATKPTSVNKMDMALSHGTFCLIFTSKTAIPPSEGLLSSSFLMGRQLESPGTSPQTSLHAWASSSIKGRTCQLMNCLAIDLLSVNPLSLRRCRQQCSITRCHWWLPTARDCETASLLRQGLSHPSRCSEALPRVLTTWQLPSFPAPGMKEVL